MDVNKLLDKAKQVCGVEFDKDLAPRLGVKPTSISNYRKGVSLPDPVVCATLAGLTGEPLAKVLGVVGEARAISSEEKKVWRRLAASAAVITLLLSSALPSYASAGKESEFNICIMRNGAACGEAPHFRYLAMDSRALWPIQALYGVLRQLRCTATATIADRQNGRANQERD